MFVQRFIFKKYLREFCIKLIALNSHQALSTSAAYPNDKDASLSFGYDPRPLMTLSHVDLKQYLQIICTVINLTHVVYGI